MVAPGGGKWRTGRMYTYKNRGKSWSIKRGIVRTWKGEEQEEEEAGGIVNQERRFGEGM